MLEIEGLSVRFGGVTAVRDVSFTVGEGEIVGLIGPNGAGKSTLIDAICGFVEPYAGRVLLGGTDLTKLSPHRRAHAGLARSWQSLDLFDDITVRENLRVPVERPDWQTWVRDLARPRSQVLTPAATAAVAEFELEADLERPPTDLSFSQRRFIATARAAAVNPTVLLLDEPAAGMSDVRRGELAKALRQLRRTAGVGLLVVDHDMPFVMDLCDRIVVLNFGQKIAEGTPAIVRAAPVVIAAYLRNEADGTDEPRAATSVVTPRPERPSGGDEGVLIAARNLAVGYYDHPVVQGIDFDVRPGEVVALLGANRAGKTTTLLTLAGAIQPVEGEVYWLNELVSKRIPLSTRAKQGLGFLPEERSVFRQLTVMENLRVDRACDIDLALTLFPELRDLRKRRAGLLSGGEQQMLGLARALARHPKVLLIDEMSLGLAPLIVTRLMDVLRQAADEHGLGVILVEQHVQEALRISDSVCVIAGARMTLSGPVAEVGHRVEEAFLADVLGTSA